MNMKLITLVFAVATSFALLADCLEDCKKAYTRCKFEVDKTGSFNYFQCINAKDACTKTCPLK